MVEPGKYFFWNQVQQAVRQRPLWRHRLQPLGNYFAGEYFESVDTLLYKILSNEEFDKNKNWIISLFAAPAQVSRPVTARYYRQ